MQLFIRTLSGETVTLEVQHSETVENIATKIFDTTGIPPDKLVFSAEQRQDAEEHSILSTPDMFGSEELTDRRSDSLWTPGSSYGSQQVPTINNDRLFFVSFEALQPLFYKCREPGCDAQVQDEDISILVKGAGLKIKALCSKHHFTSWQSAEFFNDVSFNKISYVLV
jgi:hypothetical protein